MDTTTTRAAMAAGDRSTNAKPAALGRFGIFLSFHQGAAARRLYRDELPGPAVLMATATDEHAAATAACRWLAQMDRTEDATRLALIIRDRDARDNVALIQWVERCSTPGNLYRYSVETWAHEEPGSLRRAGRERRR